MLVSTVGEATWHTGGPNGSNRSGKAIRKQAFYSLGFGSVCLRSGLKRLNGNGVTRNPAELPNVLNDFFSTVGQKLAAKVPDSNCHYNEYLINTNFTTSFFFEARSSHQISN